MTLKAPTDEELGVLALRAAARDAAATEALFIGLLPRVRNLVRYLVRGDQLVDDLTQEALIQILRGVGSYRGEGTFRAWSDRVVARCVFAKRRQRATAELTEEVLAQAGDSEELPFEFAADSYTKRRQLVAALDQLPEAQREAVILHYALGLTIPEVATELGSAEETVRSRLRLGKARLRTQLTMSADGSVC